MSLEKERIGCLAPPVAVHCPRSDDPRERPYKGNINGINYGGSTLYAYARQRQGSIGNLPNMAAKRESQAPTSEVRTSGHRLISITIGDIPHLEWVFAV